jgi:hypothetical protein
MTKSKDWLDSLVFDETQAEAAMCYPEEGIVRFVLGLSQNDEQKNEVKTLMDTNPAFKLQVDAYRGYVKRRGIKSIKDFLEVKTKEADIFIDVFASAISRSRKNARKGKQIGLAIF